MNWKNVGEAVIDNAPLVGGLLLGPGGSAAGALISNLLGVKTDDPDALHKAILNDPNAAVKLREFELTHKVEIQRLILMAETRKIEEETKQLQTVNATMRVEAESKRWFPSFWRPFWGVLAAVAFFEVVNLIVVITIKIVWLKDFAMFGVVPQIIGAFLALFSVPGAILGVSAWHRGKMQRIQSGEVPGKGIITTMIEKVRKK